MTSMRMKGLGATIVILFRVHRLSIQRMDRAGV